MKIFTASLQNELKKLAIRKKYIVFLIIEIFICIIFSLINFTISKASTGMISTSLIFSNLPITLLSFFIQIYLPLVIFMASCDLFATEINDGTIRAILVRPISRFKQYFSKVTAILILSSTYIATLFLTTTVLKIIYTHSTANIIENLLAYLLDLIPIVVLILFASMLNQFFNSPSLSIFLCIIIFIGLYILGFIVPQMSGLLFTGYLQWHNLWLGTTIPFYAIFNKMGILLGYGIIFACVGYYFYERREV